MVIPGSFVTGRPFVRHLKQEIVSFMAEIAIPYTWRRPMWRTSCKVRAM